MTLEGIFTTGDSNNISDGTYGGVLTGNNWTSPGAVFIGHGLYMLLPHGTVVNRWNAAVVDLQNIGYGLSAGIVTAKRELIPNKLRDRERASGAGWATKVPDRRGQLHRLGSQRRRDLDAEGLPRRRAAPGAPLAGRVLRLDRGQRQPRRASPPGPVDRLRQRQVDHVLGGRHEDD
jgi:hypothetical protein